ncbi:hypothetical protein M8998_07415 [Sphingobacterium sp. lm-10]|uniref:hypothetical protein n=1 Tax=Sphingobacterium sp. lm-10 TaxID=2944904 RepID=UPI00202225A0|nr:hypothetical protein [Sphingobacterium sp. lm-10]MCL7987763.1 hypothetical protein [Sphingobacterium sp. lm-10]
MDLQVNLSKNLKLHYLEENVVSEDNQLVSIQFNFTFFGEYCHAVISRKCLESSNGSVVFAESPSELHDSFIESIEDTHWDKLKDYWREFETQYNCENQKQQED